MIVALAMPRRLRELEPELLGDERHQRMQQLQQAAEHLDERVLRAAPQSGVGGRGPSARPS